MGSLVSLYSVVFNGVKTAVKAAPTFIGGFAGLSDSDVCSRLGVPLGKVSDLCDERLFDYIHNRTSFVCCLFLAALWFAVDKLNRLLFRTAAVRAAETQREDERFRVAVIQSLAYIKFVIDTMNKMNNVFRAHLPDSASTEAPAKTRTGKGRSSKPSAEEHKVFSH